MDTIQQLDPDVIALQETKAFDHQCPLELHQLGYNIFWHTGSRPGYAGTAILTKSIPDAACNIFPHSMFHEDGRVTQVDFGNTSILNVYFPNGGTRADGTEMLSYKLAFYDTLAEYLKTHQGRDVIVV